MTPSERERRIEAAMVPLERAFPRRWQRRYVANAVLDAADETVPPIDLPERHTKLAQGVWGHPDDWQRGT